ncbi:hypothetical protein F5882DRAFT_459414 [Hyaloscypha sp. PMI_1271]|nr:hypothetical protein F5882DRAFT_459414 [Hyaloscypha sp. PMI_1271]
MSLVGTGEMASTFCNTPLGCAAMNATFDLIDQPGYMDCGPFLGAWSQKEGDKWQTQFPFLLEAVSCGIDMCLYIDESNPAVTGRKIAVLCNLKGLLVTSFGNRARMSPPLVLTDGEMERWRGEYRFLERHWRRLLSIIMCQAWYGPDPNTLGLPLTASMWFSGVEAVIIVDEKGT